MDFYFRAWLLAICGQTWGKFEAGSLVSELLNSFLFVFHKPVPRRTDKIAEPVIKSGSENQISVVFAKSSILRVGELLVGTIRMAERSSHE